MEGEEEGKGERKVEMPAKIRVEEHRRQVARTITTK